jgi:adenylate kinase family enzyme
MRRVSVVGNSGSGKSTLAATLAERLGVEHIELDSLYHQPDWKPLPRDELRAVLAGRLAAPGWVVDGNYSAVRPIVWRNADTVIWLDLPRRTVMRQVLLRTLRRVVHRQELWNGNREHWRKAFLSYKKEDSIIVWAWTQHRRHREQFAAEMTNPEWTDLDFVHLTSRTQVQKFLRTLESP